MGRNPHDNLRLRDQQRANILAAALRLFVDRGFAAARISDIAREGKISQGLVYHYFPSKDDVLTALLQDSLPKLDAQARQLEAMKLPARDKVILALTALLKGIEERTDVGRYHLLIATTSASRALPAGAREVLAKHARNPYGVMARIFETGQRERTVRAGDPRQLAVLFWATIRGLAIHRAIHGATLGQPTAELLLPLFLNQVHHAKSQEPSVQRAHPESSSAVRKTSPTDVHAGELDTGVSRAVRKKRAAPVATAGERPRQADGNRRRIR